jgi:hypothetical protein
MNMRRMVITGAAALAACGVLGLAPPAAQASSAAAPTWTVAPGGSITAAAGHTRLGDTSSGAGINCRSSNGGAILASGSGLRGRGIAVITSLAFSTCFGGELTLTTTASANNPWPLNAASYDATTGVTSGNITNFMATVSGTGCSATLAGATATTPGTVKVRYTNSTHTLKLRRSGGTLHFWNVSGCPGLFNDGDAAKFTTANYTVTPGQTITRP